MTHKFFNKDEATDTWMVYCSETGGNFCTEMWKEGKQPSGVCPCCHQNINIEKRTQRTEAAIASGRQRTL